MELSAGSRGCGRLDGSDWDHPEWRNGGAAVQAFGSKLSRGKEQGSVCGRTAGHHEGTAGIAVMGVSGSGLILKQTCMDTESIFLRLTVSQSTTFTERARSRPDFL